MKLLAIDTATEACSAAILINAEIIQKHEIAPRKHAKLILKMIDELLTETGTSLTQLDALAFGRGPGAFTGVRIATGVIQGLAYATDLPVVPVSNLAALAQSSALRYRTILSAIDARMNEIYWCLYNTGDDETVYPVTEENVTLPNQISLPEVDSIYGTGSGWKTYGDLLKKRMKEKIAGNDPDAFPQARDIISLASRDYNAGIMVTAENVLPVYLRNKVTG